MKKIITIEVDVDQDNHKIEHHLLKWIKFNFQKYKTAKIKIEEIKDETKIPV